MKPTTFAEFLERLSGPTKLVKPDVYEIKSNNNGTLDEDTVNAALRDLVAVILVKTAILPDAAPVEGQGILIDENGKFIWVNMYTKEQVDDIVSVLKKTFKSVDVLPEASEETLDYIYLVPADAPAPPDVKDEFVTIREGTEESYTYYWERLGSTAIDLSGYCRKMDIVELASAAASQNIVDNTYYDIQAAVGTTNFVLPSITDDEYAHSIILRFTTSADPQITFSSADSAPIEYILGWGFDPSAKYEVNCLFNGTKWTLTYGRIA